MSTEGAREWLVTYRSRPRAHVVIWAVIRDVPGDVELEAVSSALEGWSRWPAWQARVRPGGVVNVRKRTARDEIPTVVAVLEWEEIRPRSRRISVDLPGELHAAVTRTARLAEVSVAELIRDTLLGACMRAGVDVAAPAVVFVDEPLPTMGDEQ